MCSSQYRSMKIPKLHLRSTLPTTQFVNIWKTKDTKSLAKPTASRPLLKFFMVRVVDLSASTQNTMLCLALGTDVATT